MTTEHLLRLAEREAGRRPGGIAEMAREAGITRTSLSRYLSRAVTIPGPALLRLAEVLGYRLTPAEKKSRKP